MAEQIISKRCSKCKEIKPFSEFYKNRAQADGYQQFCKICFKKFYKRYKQTEKACRKANQKYCLSDRGKIVRKRYSKSEKGKTIQKQYSQKKNGRKAHQKARKQYKLRHPERVKAQAAVNNAINAGKLPNPDTLLCHYCLKPAQEYHHWHGYEPKHYFDVVPVCTKCHGQYRPLPEW